MSFMGHWHKIDIYIYNINISIFVNVQQMEQWCLLGEKDQNISIKIIPFSYFLDNSPMLQNSKEILSLKKKTFSLTDLF